MMNGSQFAPLESAVYDTKIKLIVSLEFADYNQINSSLLWSLESAVYDTKINCS